MKISDLYGKKVESTAGRRGYVVSVNANGDRLECLICADSDENEFAVDLQNVLSVGDKIIFEDRDSAIKNSRPLRLGRAGFDEKGAFLGKLEEFTFNRKKLLKAKIGKKNYPAADLVCGDVIIVKNKKAFTSDVIKDGKIIIKKGAPVTESALETAEAAGEYVQAKMKSI